MILEKVVVTEYATLLVIVVRQDVMDNRISIVNLDVAVTPHPMEPLNVDRQKTVRMVVLVRVIAKE